MWKFSNFYGIGLIALASACGSSNNGVDVTGAGLTSGTVGGGAGLSNTSNGGAANGTSNSSIGGATNIGGGQPVGGLGAGGDTATASTGGAISTAGANGAGGNGATGGDNSTGGSLACGASVVCTATACGNIIDACGAIIPCGYNNCNVSLCGTVTPFECTPCTPLTVADCSTIGKNCGQVSDNCGGFINCGTCTQPECCGCSGTANVCGGYNNGLGNSGLASTCIAGSKGCLCDTQPTPGCAPGLKCTAQTGSKPSLCCSGTDCALPTTTTSVATCSGAGTATCTPGITIPTATSTTDSCGYAATTFKENAFICGIYATGGGAVPVQIQGFFNDEWPLTLGCATTANPVSPLPTAGIGDLFYPQLGDPTCNDTAGRPMRPSLFITDITQDPNCKTGDQQSGGLPYDAIGVFGTWTYATAGTPVRPANLAKNYWTLGTGADPLPTSVSNQCPCTAQSCPGSGLTGKGYGAEVLYEAGLISGHSYRLQIMGHDGDQTQGGDSGEACVIFCAGTGTCKPLTCADYPATVCGQMPDGCGGLTPECRKCCTPFTCANYPANTCGPQDDGCGGQTPNCGIPKTCADFPTTVCGPQDDGCGGKTPECRPCCIPKKCEDLCPPITGSIAACSSTFDTKVYAIACDPQNDGCGGVVNCYCPIG
jgi:hypothetical protein